MAKKLDKIENTNSYSKKDLLKSKKYEHKKDLINALLDDNVNYTINEVDELIKKFLEGEAK